MRIEVIEFKTNMARFAVVDADGDAELGNWIIALTWWEMHAERIAAAYRGDNPHHLPIDEIPEGWLWSVESVDAHPEVDPFECLLTRYKGRKEHRYLASGPTPRAAMLAAIARTGS